jgi:hypothetical protein
MNAAGQRKTGHNGAEINGKIMSLVLAAMRRKSIVRRGEGATAHILNRADRIGEVCSWSK